VNVDEAVARKPVSYLPSQGLVCTPKQVFKIQKPFTFECANEETQSHEPLLILVEASRQELPQPQNSSYHPSDHIFRLLWRSVEALEEDGQDLLGCKDTPSSVSRCMSHHCRVTYLKPGFEGGDSRQYSAWGRMGVVP
jgi:hypothetical protein